MPAELKIWLSSEALYQQAVHWLTGQTPPERLTDQIQTANGLSLHQVESLAALPQPEEGSVFLDPNYAVLKEAAALGWRTAWFNPQGRIAPEAMPVHDVDLMNLSQLPVISPTLADKPTLETCLGWWQVWEVPGNIRAHSQTVSRSAYVLAVLLRDRGVQVDPILTHRGGLLHDIDKINTLQQDGVHGRVGAKFLIEQGYPALAGIVREHIMSTILRPHADDRRWEVKLVYFCDKLVEGDTLVPFDQRLEALFKRYPHYQKTMARAAEPVRQLSDQICSILSIPNHENLISTLAELQYN
jgi:putative nucleotidyltransferase with HDIG domain